MKDKMNKLCANDRKYMESIIHASMLHVLPWLCLIPLILLMNDLYVMCMYDDVHKFSKLSLMLS